MHMHLYVYIENIKQNITVLSLLFPPIAFPMPAAMFGHRYLNFVWKRAYTMCGCVDAVSAASQRTRQQHVRRPLGMTMGFLGFVL